MKFKIVYDQPGRIRFRAGAYAFEKVHEPRIHMACVSEPYVQKAVVHSENGGILLEYEGGYREQVIDFVRNLDVANLPESEPDTEYQLQELDTRFKNRLAFMIARRYLAKLLIPAPSRTAHLIYRGLKFVAKGLNCLGEGKLSVVVLDGAAIGASILQLNYESA